MFRLSTASLFFVRETNCIEKNLQKSFSTLERTFPPRERVKSSKPLFSSFTTRLTESKGTLATLFSRSTYTGLNLTSPQSTNGNSSKPLIDMTKEEIQQWLKSSNFSDFTTKFLGLDGKDLASFTKDDFERIIKDTAPGIALYNAVQELKAEKAVFDLLCGVGRKEYLLSTDINDVKLPPNPARRFNFAGPIDFERHYCIPGFLRSDSLSLNTMLKNIHDGLYFVLHEQRQSGKTSFLLELRDYLNCVNTEYAALYINVEPAQQRWSNVETGVASILDIINNQCRLTFNASFGVKEATKNMDATQKLEEALTIISQETLKHGRKFVLLVDEIDSLVGDVLLTVLRQLRSGYERRFKGLFPHSIILVGLRDVRDYKIYSDEQKKYVLGGSAFNIKSESKRMRRFTKEHIQALMNQFSRSTGDKFDVDVAEAVMFFSDGQPWIVNRLLHECVSIAKIANEHKIITENDVYQAAQNIILKRETHLENLERILQDNRVRRVVEPLLSGAVDPKLHPYQEEIEYAENFGVIKTTSDGYKLSNEIYAEIIPRMLSQDTYLQTELRNVNPAFYLDANGRIKMPTLIEDFRKIYRENIESWTDYTTYKESAVQLLLFFYLQKIVNGGGRIHREFALGNDATDILIEKPLDGSWVLPKQREVIEIKTVRNSDKVKKDLSTVIQDAVEQTRRYLDKMGVEEGHVILFDQRTKEPTQLNKKKSKSNQNQVPAPLLSWEERIKKEVFPPFEEKQNNKIVKKKRVTVWCM